MNPAKTLTFLVGIVLIAGLGACKTLSPPPGTQTSRGPSSPYPSPTTTPSPPSPSMPSPTSTPSPVPTMPSPTATKPSVQLPDPTASGTKSAQGDQKGEQQQGSKTAGASDEKRQKAGDDLQKAGAKVASAGDRVGDTAMPAGSDSPPLFPDQTDPLGQGEQDPLIPETDNATESEELIFDDNEASASASADDGASGGGSPGGVTEATETSETADGGGSPGEATEAAETSETAGARTASATGGDQMGDEVRAAQEALREAGITLQRAGEAVRGARTEEELARAEELLSQARVIVIVATQDLIEAREAIGDMDADQAAVFEDAEAALNDATVAIVVATDAVTGLPDFEQLPTTAGVPEAKSGKQAELEKELEDSLIIFDGEIKEARRTVLEPAASGVPDDLPAGTVTTGSGSGSSEGEVAVTGPSSGANSQGSAPMQEPSAEEEQVALIPDDIGPGNDDDIVAQQLREAAMAETDPELREKLWEEYRRYKAGI